MSSFKQLTKDGVLKRADAYKIHFTDIVVEPGFNTREEGGRLEAHVKALFDFIMGGGQVPPLEVVPTADDKVKLVDGHCRHRAYGLAIKAGAPIEWIEVRQFQGNEVDRTARIVSSNEGLQLTQLEVARVYKRLRGYGLGPEEIALKAGKTRQHVDQLLILADAPHQVQELVTAGAVSATEAIKITRRHGEAAGDVLAKAGAGAGGKVTAKALKPWTPPAKVVGPLVEATDAFMETLTVREREILDEIAFKGAMNQTVMVDGAALLKLLECHETMTAERTKAAERARAAQEKAAQTDIEMVWA